MTGPSATFPQLPGGETVAYRHVAEGESSQSLEAYEKLSPRLVKRDETETPHEHVAGDVGGG